MIQKVLMGLFGTLLLAACGAAATLPPPTATPEPEEVTVTLTDFQIEASKTTFEAGRTYRFIVTNTGTQSHEFMIMPPVEDTSTFPTATPEGSDEGMDMGDGGDMMMEEMDAMALAMIEEEDLPPGATQTLEITFEDDASLDELEFACHVPGHYLVGMRQPIEVTR
jgi:uncharacterized cupredoxin-like copper-binding protein